MDPETLHLHPKSDTNNKSNKHTRVIVIIIIITSIIIALNPKSKAHAQAPKPDPGVADDSADGRELQLHRQSNLGSHWGLSGFLRVTLGDTLI